MEIKFKGQIRKWSNSSVVTVPAAYVQNGQLKEDTVYEFTVVEVKP